MAGYPFGVTPRDLRRGQRLRDGDVVRGRFDAGDAIDGGDAVLQLKLGGGVRWWKALKAVNENDQEIWTAELQDDTRESDELFLTEDDIESGARLELWKAKEFGIRRHVYSVEDLTALKGKRVTLTWSAD